MRLAFSGCKDYRAVIVARNDLLRSAADMRDQLHETVHTSRSRKQHMLRLWVSYVCGESNLDVHRGHVEHDGHDGQFERAHALKDVGRKDPSGIVVPPRRLASAEPGIEKFQLGHDHDGLGAVRRRLY